MSRIQEKISRIVRNQLPEHIKNDYELFVKFLEYYYEYLEQDQQAQELIQNARSYADIDTTAASFIQYFLVNYGSQLPTTLSGDKQLLIKKLKDLYEAKGSELSFKQLFRILYDADVAAKYPYENVLRASDGTWQQLVSVRVETLSGDPSKINNHVLYTVKNSIRYNTAVVKTTPLTPTLTEIFLTPFSTIVVDNILRENDEVFTVENGIEVFRGRVKLTTTGYSIQNGGLNFKTGQIFKVNAGGAVNTLFKVTNVSSQGTILDIRFVNYGYNFTSNLTLNFNPTSVVGSVSDKYNTLSNGFSESGSIFLGSDYFAEDYCDPLYVMTVVESFSSDQTVAGGTTAGTVEPSIASINFTLGTLGRYPGLWTTNKGFISDGDIRLQDGELYQPFAYQLFTDIDINTFYDIITDTIHPAGQRLFNNRILDAQLNVSSNVNIISTANISIELNDTLSVVDIIDVQNP